MTTPANRAPRFVVLDRDGGVAVTSNTEVGAIDYAARHHDRGPFTVHPIGAALPVAEPVKTLGQVAYEAAPERAHLVLGMLQSDWEKVAAAVIAAHEASVRYETVERWAVFDATDETWWDNDNEKWSRNKNDRTLFRSRGLAHHALESGERLVKVTTRRRVAK